MNLYNIHDIMVFCWYASFVIKSTQNYSSHIAKMFEKNRWKNPPSPLWNILTPFPFSTLKIEKYPCVCVYLSENLYIPKFFSEFGQMTFMKLCRVFSLLSFASLDVLMFAHTLFRVFMFLAIEWKYLCSSLSPSVHFKTSLEFIYN